MRTNVGVYFCGMYYLFRPSSSKQERTNLLTHIIGPNVAAREIKKACKAATTREVNFSFWKEHF